MSTLFDARLDGQVGKPPVLRPFRIHAELDLKDFWRSPVQLAFIVAMPVMFYVIFGFAFRGSGAELTSTGQHTLTMANRAFAGVLVFSLLSVALANVAISLAVKRHGGLFKRFRTTPVSPLAVMGGYLVNILVTAILVCLAVTAIGVVGLGVQLPLDRLPALLTTILLAFVTIAPVGIALSLVPPSAESAVPLVNAVFFPAAFLSGAFVAIPFPGSIQWLVDLLPGKPLLHLLTGALAQSGPVWDPAAAWLLLGWGALGVVISVRRFSWASEAEPRRLRREAGAQS